MITDATPENTTEPIQEKTTWTGLEMYQDANGELKVWNKGDKKKEEPLKEEYPKEKGVKYDSNKPEYGLLPPIALLEMAKNLTVGAQKYSRENWRKVPDGKRRYFDAAQRHLWAWKMQEVFDPENGLHHLAAAAVNIMFALELDLLEYQQNKDSGSSSV